MHTTPVRGESANRLKADALRTLIARQRPRLVAFVRRRAPRDVDAEDVVHAALQRALTKHDVLQEVINPEAWLTRITQNALVDELRRRRSRAPAAEGTELTTCDDAVVRECACVLVQLSQLRPEYASLLQRVVVGGVSVAEAAAERGLTANAASVRLHRARAALREQLRRHCGASSWRSCIDCECAERACCDA